MHIEDKMNIVIAAYIHITNITLAIRSKNHFHMLFSIKFDN